MTAPLNNHPATCTCRQCRIITLLDHLPEVESGNDNTRRQGTGTTGPQMGTEYHDPAYVELRRCLDLMRTTGRQNQRWHLLTYFEAPIRLVDTRVRVTGPNRGKKTLIDVRIRQRVLPKEVRLEKVRHGLAFIEANYRCDPSLPAAFLKHEQVA